MLLTGTNLLSTESDYTYETFTDQTGMISNTTTTTTISTSTTVNRSTTSSSNIIVTTTTISTSTTVNQSTTSSSNIIVTTTSGSIQQQSIGIRFLIIGLLFLLFKHID